MSLSGAAPGRPPWPRASQSTPELVPASPPAGSFSHPHPPRSFAARAPVPPAPQFPPRPSPRGLRPCPPTSLNPDILAEVAFQHGPSAGGAPAPPSYFGLSTPRARPFPLPTAANAPMSSVRAALDNLARARDIVGAPEAAPAGVACASGPTDRPTETREQPLHPPQTPQPRRPASGPAKTPTGAVGVKGPRGRPPTAKALEPDAVRQLMQRFEAKVELERRRRAELVGEVH